MQRRVASAAAPARASKGAPADLAGALGAAGPAARAFRIRHREGPPYEWELHLQGAAGADLVLSLPRGMPWGEGESRVAELARPGETSAAPTWDEGRYQIKDAAERDTIVILLEGSKVRGRYALRKEGARIDLTRLDAANMRPFPDRILPMLAHASGYPANDAEYAFELKWDGVRAIAYLDGDRLTLRSRNLNNITAQYPELEPMGPALADRQLVLDGEIVALNEQGRPSFGLLQNRLGVVQKGLAQKRSEDVPVLYIIFDILYLDGRDTMSLPYEERRDLLEALPLRGDAWRVAPVAYGDGKAMLELPGWEGVVAKRLGSAYEPGARSRAWIKIKRQRRQELVIGGWSEGKGSRAGQIGALLVGYYEPADPGASRPARFVYAGSVGTGFTQATLDMLKRLLAPDVRKKSPFDTPIDKKSGVTFVEPRHVAEFEFTEWTGDGKLRHPSYKGLREDKEPRQVAREDT